MRLNVLVVLVVIGGKSEDALHAVLGAIIAPCPPIVYRLGNEFIYMSANVFGCHTLPVGEESEF